MNEGAGEVPERSPASHANWLDAFSAVYDQPNDLAATLCPQCGSRTLNLIFVVSDLILEGEGVAVFWCDTCRRGLMPSRSLIPQGGVKVRKGTEAIPNYVIVSES